MHALLLISLGIVGGEAGGPSFAVALSDGAMRFCSGALVGPRTVVTAAHCVDPAVPVRVGTATSRRAVRHPRWAGGSAFDLALLELDTPLGIAPVPLASSVPDAPVTLSGFGTQALRSVEARVLASSALTLTVSTDGGAPCGGDSGGPAVMQGDGGEVLVALISSGAIGCDAETTLVRLDGSALWVRSTMAQWEGASCGHDGACAAGCATRDLDCVCAADGRCGASCPDSKLDVDCASDCGLDGACSAGPCAQPDQDCLPDGAQCGSALQCTQRRCVAIEPGTAPRCARACAAGDACPMESACDARGVCVPRANEPVATGCAQAPLEAVGAIIAWWFRRRRARAE